MRKRPYQAGDLHWTRQPGVKRTPWTKLKPKQVEALCNRYRDGETPTNLSRIFRIARPTVYRHLRANGLISADV